MDGARAAESCAAAELRAGQVQSVAQNPKQRGLGGHIHFMFTSVYLKSYLGHGFEGWGMANIVLNQEEKGKGQSFPMKVFSNARWA